MYTHLSCSFSVVRGMYVLHTKIIIIYVLMLIKYLYYFLILFYGVSVPSVQAPEMKIGHLK